MTILHKTSGRDMNRVQELEQKLAYNEKLKYVARRINSADNIDEILINLKDDIQDLFNAEGVTIYAVDTLTNELYSKHSAGSEIKEIRVPVSPSSISGYTAYAGETLNISDVHDNMELKNINPEIRFDGSWDEKTGFRTKQVLAAPIRFENRLFGVIQLINKEDGGIFSAADEHNIREIARILGIAFRNQTRMGNTRFHYLVRRNIISEEELKQAMIISRQQKQDIETVLVEQMNVRKADLGASLARFYGCRFVEFNERMVIPAESLKGLNLSYLKRAKWVPLSVSAEKAVILVDDPSDMKTAEIKNLIRAGDYEFRVGLKEDIVKCIESVNRSNDEGIVSITDVLAELDTTGEASGVNADNDDGELDENAGAIVRLVNRIIIDACEKGASDIHIEPSRARKKTDVRFRIDGVCMRHLEVPFSHSAALVSRLKIMANLDIAERRLPQDGKIKFHYRNRPVELRVATCPTVGGEDVVMRILSSGEPIPLDKMSFSERDLIHFRDIITKPYGIVLVVGPTGSGKTTTLHSALGFINTPDRKIWTAEDPVEITQYGLRQVQIRPKIKFDFAAAMRSFLRADPDVIMVGEMRDYETAATGIEASLTGHLVFSTLHTNSAPETVTRLIDLGIDPFNFADSLLGIMAQRLIRTFCSECREPYHPSGEEFNDLAESYGKEQFAGLGIENSNDLVLYRAKGCDACGMTGYRGRAGIYELLLGTDDMKRLVQAKSPVERIREQAINDGMKTLFQDGIEKVLQGISDMKMVRRVCMA